MRLFNIRNIVLTIILVECLVARSEGAGQCPPNDGSVYPSSLCSCVDGDVLCHNITSWPQLHSTVELRTLSITNSSFTLQNNTFQNLIVNRLILSYCNLKKGKIESNAFVKLKVNDLDLSHNKLESIPSAVTLIPELKGLDISHNGLSDFSDSDQKILKKLGDTLVRFAFGSQDITKWPTALKDLPRLEELNVIDCAFLLMPLSSFYGFEQSLKKLRISGTSLLSVPLAFGRLLYLEELVFDNNMLVGDYGMNVPTVEGLLPHLAKISLNHDNITTFPDILSRFNSLREVKLDRNNLKFVSEKSAKQLSSITSLSLQNSGITRIPGTLQLITGLTSVDLSGNRIHTIYERDIESLTQLQVLKVNNNPLIFLAGGTFTKASNLELVELRNSNLTNVPCGIRRLRLTNQDITVDLTGNKIECTCSLRWLYDWKEGSPRNRILRILGDCVTIPSSIQHYLKENLQHCPPNNACANI